MYSSPRLLRDDIKTAITSARWTRGARIRDDYKSFDYAEGEYTKNNNDDFNAAFESKLKVAGM